MLKPEAEREEIYQNNYLKKLHKSSKITNYICVLFCFIPAVLVVLLYDIQIPWSAVITGWLAIASAIGVVWVVEPVGNFTIVGSAGTYINVVAGNTSNMRIPCAVMAQKSVGVEAGTPEGSLISTLGICTSVFVNIPILAVGAVLSSIIMSYLPQGVLDAFNFLLPALFGAVYVQFAMRNDGVWYLHAQKRKNVRFSRRKLCDGGAGYDYSSKKDYCGRRKNSP